MWAVDGRSAGLCRGGVWRYLRFAGCYLGHDVAGGLLEVGACGVLAAGNGWNTPTAPKCAQ
jgi:hypothetical protein